MIVTGVRNVLIVLIATFAVVVSGLSTAQAVEVGTGTGSVLTSVIDGDGEALGGITVELQDGDGETVTSEFTDGDGAAEFTQVADGDYTVRFSSSDELWVPQTEDVSVVGGSTETVAVTLVPVEHPSGTGIVTGIVRDADGPLAGAEVSLLGVADGEFYSAGETTTATDGSYTFDNLVIDDTYSIKASAHRHATTYLGGSPDAGEAARFVAVPGPTSLATITLPFASSLGGVVSDSSGPVRAELRLYRWVYDAGTSGPGALVAMARTESDENGAYELSVEQPGDYTVHVEPDESSVARSAWLGGSAQEPTEVDDTFVTFGSEVTAVVRNIALPDASFVSGTVRGQGSAPLSDATARLYAYQGDEWTEVDQSVTGTDGVYRLRVEPGTRYTVKLGRSGYTSTFLGGGSGLPETPDDTNSFVASTNTPNLADVVLVPRVSSLGKVAGQAGQDHAFCRANLLPAGLDISHETDLPFDLKFFGEIYESVFVNDHGNVTFGAENRQFTPSDLTGSDSPAIIAAFYADMDQRGEGSSRVTYGSSPDGKSFCVTWADMGYFSSRDDKLNTAQLILTSRADVAGRDPGDFDITLNYDQIQWEAGEDSEGVDGLGGTSAAVGYSAGTGNPGTYFQLAGSFVNGALLDGGPNALISGKQNSSQDGRYIFEVRNSGIVSTLGALTGKVTRASSQAGVADAFVEACKIVDGEQVRCYTTQTATDGSYSFSGVQTGSYSINVSPQDGGLRGSGATATVAAGTSTVVPTIELAAPTPIPPGTTITSVDNQGGVPVVYYQEPLVLTTPACATGTSTVIRQGNLATAPGNKLTATIPQLYPSHGDATVSTSVTCAPGVASPSVSFDIYIDPSGHVLNQYGAPVAGAKVTLLKADTVDGDYEAVPDGSAVMSGSNRKNPDTTDANGFFRWDVIAGWYRVQVTKAGCVDVTTEAMEVPPERVDLVIKLTCNDPPPAKTLTISGPARVGTPLTLVGDLGEGFVRVDTAWTVNGVTVATTPGYTPVAADAGKPLTATATVKRSSTPSAPGSDEIVTFTTFAATVNGGTTVASAIVVPPAPPAPPAPIKKIGSSVTAKVKKATIKTNQKGIVTVTVKAAGRKPTGKITIYAGAKKVGVGTLKNGKVIIKLSKLKKGVYKLVARYGGDARVNGAKAKAVKLKVKKK
jgi:hypothetical protein